MASTTLCSHVLAMCKVGIELKVACRVQIWKKTFCQNSDKFGYSFIKNDIMFMYILCIYKKPHYFKPI